LELTKNCCVCKTDKSIDEFYKHKRSADGLTYECKSCIKARHESWKSRNREKYLFGQRRYYEENRERLLDYKKRYWIENRETLIEKGKKYYWDNREALREKQNEDFRNRRYPENKEFYCSRARMRDYKSITPKWADTFMIWLIYKNARRITKETGIPHEVDHIIPVNGSNVCGLHVENNLQILPRLLNRRKSNELGVSYQLA